MLRHGRGRMIDRKIDKYEIALFRLLESLKMFWDMHEFMSSNWFKTVSEEPKGPLLL